MSTASFGCCCAGSGANPVLSVRVNRQHQDVIDYLREENRVLRADVSRYVRDGLDTELAVEQVFVRGLSLARSRLAWNRTLQ